MIPRQMRSAGGSLVGQPICCGSPPSAATLRLPAPPLVGGRTPPQRCVSEASALLRLPALQVAGPHRFGTLRVTPYAGAMCGRRVSAMTPSWVRPLTKRMSSAQRCDQRLERCRPIGGPDRIDRRC